MDLWIQHRLSRNSADYSRLQKSKKNLKIATNILERQRSQNSRFRQNWWRKRQIGISELK